MHLLPWRPSAALLPWYHLTMTYDGGSLTHFRYQALLHCLRSHCSLMRYLVFIAICWGKLVACDCWCSCRAPTICWFHWNSPVVLAVWPGHSTGDTCGAILTPVEWLLHSNTDDVLFDDAGGDVRVIHSTHDASDICWNSVHYYTFILGRWFHCWEILLCGDFILDDYGDGIHSLLFSLCWKIIILPLPFRFVLVILRYMY